MKAYTYPIDRSKISMNWNPPHWVPLHGFFKNWFLKTKNFTLHKIDQEYEDPIVKAEREFFEIIKQEQEARLNQRQKKQDPSAQDLEWKLLLDNIDRFDHVVKCCYMFLNVA